MRCGKSSLGLGRYIASDGQRDADENARIVPVLSFPHTIRTSKSAYDAVDGSIHRHMSATDVGAGQGDHPPPTEAPLRPGVLREAAAVPGWGRGLRHVASLVAATQAPPEKLAYVASFDPTRKTSRRHGGG
jgi:hypothetical protein